jgi:hypothetical protein
MDELRERGREGWLETRCFVLFLAPALDLASFAHVHNQKVAPKSSSTFFIFQRNTTHFGFTNLLEKCTPRSGPAYDGLSNIDSLVHDAEGHLRH